eukprot:355322_1
MSVYTICAIMLVNNVIGRECVYMPPGWEMVKENFPNDYSQVVNECEIDYSPNNNVNALIYHCDINGTTGNFTRYTDNKCSGDIAYYSDIKVNGSCKSHECIGTTTVSYGNDNQCQKSTGYQQQNVYTLWYSDECYPFTGDFGPPSYKEICQDGVPIVYEYDSSDKCMGNYIKQEPDKCADNMG